MQRGATTSGMPSDMPAGQRGAMPPWEWAFLLAASLNYWTDLLRHAFPGIDGASIAFRAIHFAFYGAFALLLLRRWQPAADTAARMPLMVLFLLLPLASTLWSVNPGETPMRAVALLGSSLYAIYLAASLRPEIVLRLLAWTAALAAAISLFLIAAVPSIGLMSEGEYVNVWSGAFIHKNGLGQMTALGAIISLVLLLSQGLHGNRIIAAGLALNLALLAGSRSLTSQIVFVACVVMIFTVARCLRFAVRNAGLLALVLAPVLLIVAALASTDSLSWLLTAAGKSPTLSSRLPLWEILFGYMDERYWLGWGYEAFFSDANFAIRVIEAKLHFKPFYAHNGYIEVWLALGAIGSGILAALFVTFAVRAVRRLYGNPTHPLFLLCFVYIFVFLMQNFAEATILQRNNMSWCLFVLLFGLLAREPVFAAATAARPQWTPPPLLPRRRSLEIA